MFPCIGWNQFLAAQDFLSNLLPALCSPSWGWCFPPGCVGWWWCQTWLRRRPARWCTPLLRSCQCPGRGLWSYPPRIPAPTTRGLAGERSLWSREPDVTLPFTAGVQLQTALTLVPFMWALGTPAGTFLPPGRCRLRIARVRRSGHVVLNALITPCWASRLLSRRRSLVERQVAAL